VADPPAIPPGAAAAVAAVAREGTPGSTPVAGIVPLGRPPSLGATGFYLMLAVAAAVALAVAHLIRILAVRLPWNS